MVPNTFTTKTSFQPVGATQSSILISMNGTLWKIPVELA
jgi:hypothetical protein